MTGTLDEQLRKLRSKVQDIVSSPSKYPFFSLATVLRWLACLYKGAMKIRSALYDARVLRTHHMPCAVISVGNLTVGGTGKTPLTIYLAGLLRELGYRPVILSRGYKGLSEKRGAVVSDGRSMLVDVRHAGDEPYLMAELLKTVPVIIGSDRVGMGHIAVRRFNPDVIVLDDAFQHRRLHRDIDLLLLDERAPVGNGYLLPRGPLREPASALRRCHAVVMTRCQQPPSKELQKITDLAKPRPLLRAYHVPQLRGILPAGLVPEFQNLIATHAEATEKVAGRNIIAFAGLAHNATFWETLRQLGGNLVDMLEFDDHHPYGQEDMQRILAAAHGGGGDLLATTDKDFVRLPPDFKSSLPIMVLGIQMEFKDDPDALRNYLARRLQQIVDERSAVPVKDRLNQ